MSEPAVSVRNVAVSGFVVLHLCALVWWNVGEVEYTAPGSTSPHPAVQRFRDGVDVIDPGEVIRSTLAAYVRGTGLWQRWVLFGPDAPHETGIVELHGIERFDRSGQPVLDPVPVRTTQEPDITERTQLIGNPPCGWDRSEHPLAVLLRGSYARFHAARTAAERGRSWVGAQLTCRVRTLPPPGEPEGEPRWTTELLWAGPIEGAMPP